MPCLLPCSWALSPRAAPIRARPAKRSPGASPRRGCCRCWWWPWPRPRSGCACRGSDRVSPPTCDAWWRLPHPGVIAGGMAQLTVVISTIIATLQDRVVSWLYYADRLFQLPLGVIGVAIGVVLLPTLSHKLRSGDHEAALASENRALEFALLLTMPATVALFLAADPIMRVLFERGAFTAVDTKATASMLAALSARSAGLCLDQGAASELLRPRGHQDADDLCRHQHGGECHAELHAVRADRRHRHRHRHHAVGLDQRRAPGSEFAGAAKASRSIKPAAAALPASLPQAR